LPITDRTYPRPAGVSEAALIDALFEAGADSAAIGIGNAPKPMMVIVGEVVTMVLIRKGAGQGSWGFSVDRWLWGSGEHDKCSAP